MKLITLPNSRSLATSIRATALVFEDPRSKALLERIERIAPSDASALIIGETGTGKELIARHVHALSRRYDGPFVPVNCGALTESLVESELFGHEKGAFTGAIAQRVGWFEAANGGTIFLDEVGDLPLSVQVKLLRVLQEREIYRVGSRTPIPIDIRVIAATNVRLDEAVAAGHFREDLLYRLRVVSLELLPLRDRPGDILPIATHFVRDYSRRLGFAQPAELSKATIQALHAHAWPGNIRELENAIHHALLVCMDGRIEPENLQFAVRAAPHSTTTAVTSEDAVGQFEAALRALFERQPPQLFEQLENLIFRTAFRYCDHNQLQTARLLDISRNVVRARLLRSGDLHALTKQASARPDAVKSAVPQRPPEPMAYVAPAGIADAGRTAPTVVPFIDIPETALVHDAHLGALMHDWIS